MKKIMLAAFAIAVGVSLSLAACGGAPQQMTVKGVVTVPDDPASGNDPPVSDSSQVTITDPSGKVIAFTTLNDNAPQGATLTLSYGFTVKVPEGDSSYGIQVQGLTGTTRFTQKQMQQGPAICSGDACNGGF